MTNPAKDMDNSANNTTNYTNDMTNPAKDMANPAKDMTHSTNDTTNPKNNPTKIPHPLIAITPLLTLIALITITVKLFHDEALSGGSQVSLIIASMVCVTISMAAYKTKWSNFEARIKKTIGDTSVSIVILLFIGMLSGAWMISGIVPTFIYYGVQFMSPTFFLVCACITCAFISLVTGSSWTTIATIGVAMLGIGNALGIPVAMTAGAIISGAYFGDKMSPLSDTTVLAASVAETDLFTHIRYMVITTTPAFTISVIIFLILGFYYGDGNVNVEEYTTGLNRTFNISLWTLIVPILTGLLIYRKVPSAITLLISAISAGICALILQPGILAEIGGSEEPTIEALAIGLMKTFYTDTNVQTGSEAVNNLIATHGMAGMLNTVWLILCAMCFGSCMVESRMIESITMVILRFVKNTFSLVTSSVISGIIMNIIMGDQYLSIILNASMYKDAFRSRGYEPRLLSRTAEDSATATSVLIPWNSCGMTQSTVLGVPTLVYLPFCFFNYLTPLVSCAVAALGWKIKRNPTSETAS